MKFKVLEDESKLDIEIEGLHGKQETVLKSLQACAEGRCTCPTPEYDKLDSMALTQDGDRIGVSLKPKPGQKFERSAIETCVQHTIDKAEDE
ncbi:MAG TPA: hypothetical protein VKB51_08715 [bacterium]|nr:hypothetical protein [bacterium]